LRHDDHHAAGPDDLNQRITDAVNAHTPDLLQGYGVGGVAAATLLLAAGDYPTPAHQRSIRQEPKDAALTTEQYRRS
jgi:hypothetical protein